MAKVPADITVGFTGATAIQAEGARIGITSCLVCGAAIMLDPRDSTDAMFTHARWHRLQKEANDARDHVRG